MSDVEKRLDRLAERVSHLEEENAELRDRVDEAEQDAEASAASARILWKRLTDVETKFERNDSLPRSTFMHFLERLGADVDDYSGDPFPHLDVPKELAGMVRRHDAVIDEHEDPNPDAMKVNWVNCVKAAQNLAGDPAHERMDGYVALFASNVKSATGHSRRHCLNLIEDLGDEFEGAKWLPYQPSPKEKGSARKKQLLIDMDVWGDA